MDVALFLQRLAAQIRQYQPELIDGFLAALQILADAAADRALVQVLAANDVAAAVAYLTTAQAVDAAFQAWRDAYRTAVIGSGRYVTRNVLPKFAPPTTGAPTIVAVSRFDTLAPQVVRGIRAYEAQAVGDMMGGITEGMRQIILDGVARGINPLE
ncbi:MAG: hypothetical protein KGI71_05605, partial [Patescibacteria group bacterium]|nr:hypothetical protein [Patescibacteria group bacterium]